MTDAAESDFDREQDESSGSASSSPSTLTRVAMYVVVIVALCVVLWALTQGGDRNLWTNASVLAPVRSA